MSLRPEPNVGIVDDLTGRIVSIDLTPQFERKYLNDMTNSTPSADMACRYCLTDTTSEGRMYEGDGRHACLLCVRSRTVNHGTPFGFRARVVKNLDQGDHTCVKLTYLRKDGTIKNLGHTIMPKDMAKEYLQHIQSGPVYAA